MSVSFATFTSEILMWREFRFRGTCPPAPPIVKVVYKKGTTRCTRTQTRGHCSKQTQKPRLSSHCGKNCRQEPPPLSYYCTTYRQYNRLMMTHSFDEGKIRKAVEAYHLKYNPHLCLTVSSR